MTDHDCCDGTARKVSALVTCALADDDMTRYGDELIHELIDGDHTPCAFVLLATTLADLLRQIAKRTDPPITAQGLWQRVITSA